MWERVCRAQGTSPLRTAAEARDFPERNAHLLACLLLHAFAVGRPRDRSRAFIKPRSALAYPLAIVKLAREHRLLENSQRADDLALVSAEIDNCAGKSGVPRADVMNTLLLDRRFLVLGSPVAEACLASRLGLRQERGCLRPQPER
jgi:hypothetical protein